MQTRYVFKEQLQKLANRLGIEIRVAHYPPYCSKYNPIEHRLFPHVTRACRGVIFRTLGHGFAVLHLQDSKPTKGLTISPRSRILDKVYQTGCKSGPLQDLQEVDEDRLRQAISRSGTTAPSRRPHETGTLFSRRSLAERVQKPAKEK